MSIYEYDEEKFKRAEREYGREVGYKQGVEEGRLKELVASVEKVMKNLPADLERACAILGTTLEEYQEAKKLLL